MVFPIQSKKKTLQEEKWNLKLTQLKKTAVLEIPKLNVSSLEAVHCNFKVGPCNILMWSEVRS